MKTNRRALSFKSYILPILGCVLVASFLQFGCASSRYSKFLEPHSESTSDKPAYSNAMNALRDIYEDAESMPMSEVPKDVTLKCVFISLEDFDEAVRVIFKNNEGRVSFFIMSQVPKGVRRDPFPTLKEIKGGAAMMTPPENKVTHYIRKTGDKHLLIEIVHPEEGMRPAFSDPKMSAQGYFDCGL